MCRWFRCSRPCSKEYRWDLGSGWWRKGSLSVNNTPKSGPFRTKQRCPSSSWGGSFHFVGCTVRLFSRSLWGCCWCRSRSYHRGFGKSLRLGNLCWCSSTQALYLRGSGRLRKVDPEDSHNCSDNPRSKEHTGLLRYHSGHWVETVVDLLCTSLQRTCIRFVRTRRYHGKLGDSLCLLHTGRGASWERSKARYVRLDSRGCQERLRNRLCIRW